MQRSEMQSAEGSAQPRPPMPASTPNVVHTGPATPPPAAAAAAAAPAPCHDGDLVPQDVRLLHAVRGQHDGAARLGRLCMAAGTPKERGGPELWRRKPSRATVCSTLPGRGGLRCAHQPSYSHCSPMMSHTWRRLMGSMPCTQPPPQQAKPPSTLELSQKLGIVSAIHSTQNPPHRTVVGSSR